MEEILNNLTRDISKHDLKVLLSNTIEELIKPQKITLTVNEVAELTGIGEQKVRELVAKNNTDFPYFKVGSKTLIYKKELMIWLDKVTTEHRTI